MLKLWHSKNAAALATWATLITALFAVIAMMTPDWFGPLTLWKGILIGLGGMLALSLILAVALAIGAHGYRLIWPHVPAASEDDAPATPDGALSTKVDFLSAAVELINHDKAELEADVKAALGRLKVAEKGIKDKPSSARVIHDLASFVAPELRKFKERIDPIEASHKAIIDDYQRMLGLEARFDGALDGLKMAIQAQNKVFEDRHVIDEGNLKEFREAAAKSNAQLYLALQAIRARETERFYADIIEEEGAGLQAKVDKNEAFQGDDWADWGAGQLRLEGAMGHWMAVADGWHPKVREWINDVSPESLTSPGWGDIDALFQNHGQAIKYKTQIAKFNNWRRLRNHVSGAIYLAAFGGPHANEILETIPGGGPTVERVKEEPK